jgi:hypothetical protein
MPKDLRGFFVGAGIFVGFALVFLGFGAWAHDRDVPASFVWVVFLSFFPLSPFLSGLACGYLAGELQTRTLLALGVTAALCLAALDFAWRAAGYRDALGLPWLVGFGVLLLSIVPLVVAGGAVGAILRRGWHA